MKRVPKRRKRTLLMVLLLLTGGATINVGVAWGSLVVSQSLTGEWSCSDDWVERVGTTSEATLFRRTFPDISFEEDECLATGSRRPGWVLDSIRLVRHEWPGGLVTNFDYPIVRREVSRVACGWPAHSIQGDEICTGRNESLSGAAHVPKFVKRWAGESPLIFLPLRPILSGFALNTIFYAAILWLVFAAPGFVRRRIRIKRGQCPACGYPIGTNPVCTECGTPVTPLSKVVD